MSLETISDTARWVAVYRAMETARPDAIFRDPFAARLAGERGEAIVDSIRRARGMAWAMIVRTAVFDEIVTRVIDAHGIDLVVNLAAGLDARPWRLPLSPALRWVDVDLPEILAYKQETLRDTPTVCRYEAVATDLTDADARRALFTRLGAESTRALVITEGLLVYLGGEQVRALASDLASVPSFRWWLFDLASPDLLRMMNRRVGRNVAQARAPFQFAPAEGTRFFQPFGWREVEFRSTLEEGRRLRREMRLMPLWRLLNRISSRDRQERFRRMSGIVLLERTEG
jgi:methyltransferase (TIGR00027 family)